MGLLLQDIHIRFRCAKQKRIVAQNQCANQIIIHRALGLGNTNQCCIVDVLVRTAPKCAEHTDQRHGLSKPRKGNRSHAVVLSVVRRTTSLLRILFIYIAVRDDHIVRIGSMFCVLGYRPDTGEILGGRLNIRISCEIKRVFTPTLRRLSTLSRVHHIVAQLLLSQQHLLCAVNNEIPAQLELALSNFISINACQITHPTPQHQGNPTDHHILELTDDVGATRNHILNL